MTDDRARRIRDMRNRATGSDGSDDESTNSNADDSAADDSGDDSEDQSASSSAESSTGGESESESAVEGDDDTDTTDDAPSETVTYDERTVSNGQDTSQQPSETELDGAIADASAVTAVADVGSEPTVDASALVEDTDGYGDAAADRADEMFEQGDTLIHTSHDDESTIQMLEFYLNENRYAIEIDRISAIVEMKDITRFPRGPTAIDGVTDLRGEITGVLDPTTVLDVEQNELSDDQYIVVLERGDDEQKLGVRVTDVSQAVTYRDSQIDETGSVMDAAGGQQHDCVSGIIKKQRGSDDGDTESDTGDDRTILVAWLDIDELVATVE